jgi:hypothetical protein
MMIANWIHDSDASQVIGIRLSIVLSPASHIEKVSRSDSASYAQKRDREVPYGMKGGEF